LGEKGGDQVGQALLVGIAKVKIKITHRCLPGLAHDFNILDNRGTEDALARARFSMNPKERIRFFPSFEKAPLKEPICCSLLMSTTRNVMVRGGVRRGKPFVKVVP